MGERLLATIGARAVTADLSARTGSAAGTAVFGVGIHISTLAVAVLKFGTAKELALSVVAELSRPTRIATFSTVSGVDQGIDAGIGARKLPLGTFRTCPVSLTLPTITSPI